MNKRINSLHWLYETQRANKKGGASVRMVLEHLKCTDSQVRKTLSNTYTQMARAGDQVEVVGDEPGSRGTPALIFKVTSEGVKELKKRESEIVVREQFLVEASSTKPQTKPRKKPPVESEPVAPQMNVSNLGQQVADLTSQLLHENHLLREELATIRSRINRLLGDEVPE